MQQILSITKQFIFWIVLFNLQRAIFFIFYYHLIFVDHIEISEVLKTFYFAFKLDISTAAYILVVPLLLLIFQMIIHGKWADYANKIYTALILLVYLLISAGELGIYGEWQTKLSYKALLYLRNPDEMFNSVATSTFILLLVILLAQFAFFLFVYLKYFFTHISSQKKENIFWKIAFILLSPVIMFLGIRGGFQAIPITISQSYFSQHNILNLASVNSGYNLFYSIRENAKFEKNNVFETMPEEEARAIVDKLHEIEKDTTILILNTPKPNVVIILIESWSGDLIETLGGDPGITPRFRELEKEGLFFTQFYTTGNRSQQAMASLYAGFPAIPIITLSDYPEKYKSVPSLVKNMKKAGYFTSFYFGGQLIYGNIKSFLISNEFDKLVEGTDFDDNVPRGKLGVHDQYLFDRFLKDIGQMPEPFFTTAFTLSSHSPYDQPGERPIDWIKLENNFVNSVHYTDECLGNFMEEAKKQSWYANTLFIIMSDHSHASYKSYPLASFDYHQIPLLITGGALSHDFRGKQMDFLSSNVDVTTTLLKQLKMPTDEFFWSKNMLNPFTEQFAFFELNEGLGWKRPYGEQIVNLKADLPAYSTAPNDKKQELDKEGRAYMQIMLKEFLGM